MSVYRPAQTEEQNDIDTADRKEDALRRAPYFLRILGKTVMALSTIFLQNIRDGGHGPIDHIFPEY